MGRRSALITAAFLIVVAAYVGMNRSSVEESNSGNNTALGVTTPAARAHAAQTARVILKRKSGNRIERASRGITGRADGEEEELNVVRAELISLQAELDFTRAAKTGLEELLFKKTREVRRLREDLSQARAMLEGRSRFRSEGADAGSGKQSGNEFKW